MSNKKKPKKTVSTTKKKNKKNDKPGFTLIELIVAIAILGVISLIAIPTVNTIQNSNKNTKFKAYEKSIKVGAKAYTDAYDEDLFGITNSGCAIIKYSDLKDKDLISDIQLKGIKCDNDSETFVYVMKDKHKNRVFYSNIVCHDESKKVYSNKEDNRVTCAIEDGNAPTVSLIFDPSKETYYLGDKPKARIRISDKGVGLKENQRIKYVWYKNGVVKTSTNTLEFKNKNYQGSVSRYIEMPADLENIDESTDYTLKVFTDSETGKLCDVDLNCTDTTKKKTLSYFVGQLQIKMKAGNGYMTDPHGTAYSVASNDSIVKNGNDPVISIIKYNGTGDLYNYDNPEYINIRRAHYHMDSGQEWKMGNKVYNQNTVYALSDFGYTNEDLIYENKTAEVTANWQIDVHTLTYDNNGGTGCTSKRANYGDPWGTLCEPYIDGCPQCTFKGWKSGSTTITENTTVEGDLTVKADWYIPNIKPNTPTISNPTGGNWTNASYGVDVSVTGIAAALVKQWYITYDKVTLSNLNDSGGNSSKGQISFKTSSFTSQMERVVYVRLCSLAATSATDPNNCSDYASTIIRIDKTPPVMYTINKSGRNKVFAYNPSRRGSVSNGVTINDISCNASSAYNASYSDNICVNWSWKYKKVPYSNGQFWWGWDDIICKDAGGSGCNNVYWYWNHESKQSPKWCKWNKKIDKSKTVNTSNCNKGKTAAFDHNFYAGFDRPHWKEGQAYATDNAGNSGEVFKWRLDVVYKGE